MCSICLLRQPDSYSTLQIGLCLLTSISRVMVLLDLLFCSKVSLPSFRTVCQLFNETYTSSKFPVQMNKWVKIKFLLTVSFIYTYFIIVSSLNVFFEISYTSVSLNLIYFRQKSNFPSHTTLLGSVLNYLGTSALRIWRNNERSQL